MQQRKHISLVFSILAILAFAMAFFYPAAASAGPAPQGGGGERGYNPDTGQLIFVGALPGEAIPSPAEEVSALSVEENGLAFIGLYAAELGLSDPPNEMEAFQSKPALEGGSVVRYRQVYQGVPVFGADTVLNINDNGGLTALSAKVVPNLSLDINPAITAEEAVQAALRVVARTYQVDAAVLTASEPELWIFDESLFTPSRWSARLVWRMEVGAENLPLHEVVLVDAQNGMIALHYSQIDNAEVITVYDLEGGYSLPGTLKCSYPNPAGCDSIPDARLAYDFSQTAYEYYWYNLGRDSIDNAGGTIISSVRAGTIANAAWTGTQMWFGPNYVTDDILGHEYTHAVTDYESELINWAQPGAISESLSDVFGELVDLSYTGNDDSADMWLIGEDLPGGAWRNMKNPPAPPAPLCTYPTCSTGQHARQPDSMTSTYYYLALNDNRGVHINSGVNNKAAYLMFAGGTFGGKTVAALGLGKTAHIYYKAQTDLLGSGSTYMDLYHILYQSCVNLVGSYSITMDDCREVRDATDAVKMNQTKSATIYPVADFCPTGQVLGQTLFSDDFESDLDKWTISTLPPYIYWGLNDHNYHAASGIGNLYYQNLDGVDDSADESNAAMTSSVSLPSGKKVFMRFEHDYVFDYYVLTYYDGGVLEYSLNGGAWTDASAKFSAGQNYNGTISTTYGNPLKGRKAFVKLPVNITQSRYDLSTLGGKNIKFRFRAGTTDFSISNWWIDNVRIYTCIGVPAIPTLQTPAANALVTDRTPTLNWADSTPDLDHYQIQVDNDNTFTTPLHDDDTLTASQYDVPANLDPNKTYYWRVRAFTLNEDTKGWTAGRAFRTAILPPVLSAPAESEKLIYNRPTFDWGDVSSASGYTIQISKNSAFTSLVPTTAVTASTYTPAADLPANLTLWWRVQAKGTNGPSAWSAVRTLKTANPPSVPNLVSPANNALTYDYSPTLDWSDSTLPAGTNLDYYQCQVDDENTFATPLQDLVIDGGSEVDYPSDLDPNNIYYWRVRAYNWDGEYSSWSSVRSFRTALEVPGLLSPTNGETLGENIGFFAWWEVSGASGYTLQVSNNTAFTSLVVNVSVDRYEYETPTELPANTLLYYRVRATGSNGPSLWSDVWSFTTATPPSTPALASPANNALTRDYTPTLRWNVVSVPASTTFDYYKVEIFKGYIGGWMVVEDYIYDLNTAEYTPSSDLDSNNTFYWRVHAANTDEHANQFTSQWSSSRYFRTALPPPVLSAPSNGSSISDTKPIFDWGDVSGAIGYYIQVSENSTFTWLEVNTGVTGGSNSTYTPTTALPTGMTLYWRVKTYGTTNGPSAYSDYWTFCISPGCP